MGIKLRRQPHHISALTRDSGSLTIHVLTQAEVSGHKRITLDNGGVINLIQVSWAVIIDRGDQTLA